MLQNQETQVTSIRIRASGTLTSAEHDYPQPEWIEANKNKAGESLLRNFAVASALVLCAVTLRTGAIPSLSDGADVVMTAATDQSLLDDQLGKLSFVSALFPEAVLVFGEDNTQQLSMPVSGGVVVHVWSEAEPYMSWRTSSSQVTSASSGEVIGVYHGNGDERLVQIMGNDGLSCLYGNLREVYVQTGDAIRSGDIIGRLSSGQDFVLEVRQNGMSVDPAIYLGK